jgi:SAM-dependent methyltransferase
MPLSSSDRFLGRVDHYAKHRPSYPTAAIDLLASRCGLKAGARVIDLGSGTGMRRYSDEALGGGNFQSQDGTAENTRMPDAHFDLLVAGQSFHWFDPERTRIEALRILKPGAWAALLWNERPPGANAFLDEYEALLRRYAPEYDAVVKRRAEVGGIRRFFGREPQTATFANQQVFDFEGLADVRSPGARAAHGGSPGGIRAASAGGQSRLSLSDTRVFRAARLLRLAPPPASPQARVHHAWNSSKSTAPSWLLSISSKPI